MSPLSPFDSKHTHACTRSERIPGTSEAEAEASQTPCAEIGPVIYGFSPSYLWIKTSRAWFYETECLGRNTNSCD